MYKTMDLCKILIFQPNKVSSGMAIPFPIKKTVKEKHPSSSIL
jgi:hypothetical protein